MSATIPTPPTGAGTAPGGTGTPRTLERDAHVAAAGIVAFLLTALAWKLAWDITTHLEVTYSSEKLLLIRTPLFLISVILIGAGAFSYIARVLGRSFRNVVFDKRNATMAQWALFGFAAWDALYTARQYLPSEVRSETKEYSLAIALVIVGVILRAFQKIYGTYGSGGVGRSSYNAVTRGEGRSLLYLVGVALLIAAGLWGLWWVYQQANRRPESYAVERVVVQPPDPPAPEFIFTDQYGIALGRTFKVFATKAGETNGPFVIAKPGKISWGTFTPNNLLVFRDGVQMNTKQHFTNVGPNLIGEFTFTAKSNVVEYWVATGLSHRVRN